jgi:hypothetical protein
LVAAFACSVGLHWAVLQSIAWMGMLVTYSQQLPLAEAMVKTFDGNHPCPLCKEIARGKHSERKAESSGQIHKLEFSYSAAAFVFSAPCSFWQRTWPQQTSLALTYSPPIPPPRNLPV